MYSPRTDFTWFQVMVRQHQLGIRKATFALDLELLQKAPRLALIEFLHDGNEEGGSRTVPT